MYYDKNWLLENDMIFKSEKQENDFLQIIQDELELRIGRAFCENLSKKQIYEFEYLIDHEAPDEEIARWLVENCPDFQKIIETVQTALENEILANKDAILSGGG